MESTNSTPPSFPTLLVRACASCARSKAKCVPGQDADGKCQRCHRLNKICEAVVPVGNQPRKRRQIAARVQKDQVEKLEQKLDGLVTLLTAAQNGQPIPNDSIPTTDDARTMREPIQTMDFTGKESQRTEPSYFPRPTPMDVPRPFNNYTRFDQPPVSVGYTTGETEWQNASEPTFAEATILLDRFRDEMCQYFPFVVLPKSITPQELLRERPFLYNCILAVSSRNFPQQALLGKKVTKQLAERLVVNGERNIDLLLGVLVYMAWCFLSFWNLPHLTLLLSSSMTLIWDLGLGRPLPSAPPNKSDFESVIRENTTAIYLATLNTMRTPEERRAFLGHFFLASMSSVFFRRPAMMQFSPYVEECWKYLDERGDKNDKFASAVVRLQMIIERIIQSPWHDKSEAFGITPSTMYTVRSIQEQLKQFRQNLDPDLKSNVGLLMQYHYAEMMLYEVGLSKPPVDIISTGPQFQRLEALQACLQAISAFVNVYLSTPVIQYFSFTMPSWSHVTSCLIILQMLSSFHIPGWDLDYVRQTLDFKEVINRLIERFNVVNAEPGCEDAFLFTRISHKLCCIRDHIEAKESDPSAVPRPDIASRDFRDPVITNGGDLTDFFDDAWLRDILAEPWDTQANGYMT